MNSESDDSSEEEEDTVDEQEQNLTTAVQCSDGFQPKSVPPRDLSVVTLRGDANAEQTHNETRMREIQERHQNLTTAVQCSNDSQSESKNVPPSKQPVARLRGRANVAQTHIDTRIIREIKERQQITDETWNTLKETDAVMAINQHFNNKISEQIMKMAIVEFVVEKGHLQFESIDLMRKIPENEWN